MHAAAAATLHLRPDYISQPLYHHRLAAGADQINPSPRQTRTLSEDPRPRPVRYVRSALAVSRHNVYSHLTKYTWVDRRSVCDVDCRLLEEEEEEFILQTCIQNLQ